MKLSLLCTALLTSLLLPVPLWAGPLEEDRVKAGFVLNFAKYVEWPAPVLVSGELRVCGVGLHPLSGKLAELHGRQVQGREVRVRLSGRPEEWRDCHILFLPAEESLRAEALLRVVGPMPVLTVGDGADFTRDGGMIGLKLRFGRIRFDINLGAARRAGLNFSSQLLKLADEVIP